MKRFVVNAAATIAFILFCISPLQADPVENYKVSVHGVYVNVVSVDLDSDEVEIKPAVALNDPLKKYSSEKFEYFIQRTNPVAAINGTYHDTTTLKPVGTIIIDRGLENQGTHGTAVCFAKNGEIHFYLTCGICKYFIPWTAYEQALTTGPTLVYGGKIYLNPRLEKFKDPKVYGNSKRSAVGKTRDNHLLLVTVPTPVSLNLLADIMYELGSTDAVTLDGGGSSALYYKGKYITYTNRELTNFLVVTSRAQEVGIKL